MPKAKRVGVLYNSASSMGLAQLDEVRNAAHTLGVKVITLGADNADESVHALKSVNRTTVDAVLITGDLLMLGNRAEIANTLLKAKIPGIYASPVFHSAGALTSYGGDMKEAARKLATYVDRTLPGTKPEDLPVEQLSSYELVINERIAKEIGLPVPQTLLMRANESIK